MKKAYIVSVVAVFVIAGLAWSKSESLMNNRIFASDAVQASDQTTTAVQGPGACLTVANTAAISIPASGAGSPYPSNITVTGLGGTVTKVTVKLNGLAHIWPNDIDVLLVGPGGQNAIIMSDVGGGSPITGVTLTLDDSAALFMSASTLITGTFRPTNIDAGDSFPAPAPTPSGGSAFTVFNGTAPNGTWSLYAVDDASGDMGNLAGGWELSVSTTTCAGPTPSPSPTPAASPSPTPLAGCVQPPANLVSWWRADGNYADFLGGNTGTQTGGVTFAAGKVGQAFNLDGTDDIISFGNPVNLQLTTALTAEAWIRPDTTIANYRTVVSKWSQTADASWGLFITGTQDLSGTNIYAIVANANGQFTDAGGGNIPIGVAAPLTHVAMTYSAADGIKVYINGVLIQSDVSIGNIRNGTDVMRIGNDSGLISNRYFDGLVDEVGIYSRALSLAEIQSIYNAGISGKCAGPTSTPTPTPTPTPTLTPVPTPTAPAGPPNDHFANAQVISGAIGSVTGTNVNATKQAGEPNHAGNPGGASVWYRWQAPVNGDAYFNTLSSNFDTTLGIYTGSSVNALTLIGNNDNAIINDVGFIQSEVRFSVAGGTIYYIAVDGAGGVTGNVGINWGVSPTPGQGREIVFTSLRDGNLETYIMNADGTGQTRISNNPANDINPSMCPCGNRIAFESYRDGSAEIYVMNADGAGQTRLTNNSALDRQPTFSSDGSRIAFESNRDGNFEIYVMNADGTGQTRLTNSASGDFTPSFSPDGNRIAFERDAQIYVMNADGTGQIQITGPLGPNQLPDFSPDGNRIVFLSSRDGNFEIYAMNANGTGQTRLTNNSANDQYPAFSPDGTRIAFESSRDGNVEIYVMNADGTNPTRLTNNPASDGGPDWGPPSQITATPTPTPPPTPTPTPPSTPTPTPPATPIPGNCATITGLNPVSGRIGNTVTITGTNFTGVTSVRFLNNVISNFTINSATQITATVPATAVSGPITILKDGCSNVQTVSFTIIRDCPTVSSFNPTSGSSGTPVTITGTNLNDVTSVRFFNNVLASFTINSPTQITATAPATAVTGPITLTKDFCNNVDTVTNFTMNTVGTPTPTPGGTPTPGTAAYRINAGGDTVPPFSANNYYSNGATYGVTSNIDTSGAIDPAPADVYRTEHYGENFNYTFPLLPPGATYRARLHFAEIYYPGPNPGERVFNVAINGIPVLSNYDIIADVGAKKAVVKEFVTTANGSGQIVIAFSTVTGYAKVNGIEIIAGGTPSGTPTPTPGGTPAGCVVPPANMVGWWPGDGNASDIQGTNNGSLTGGATATAIGKVAQAFSFNGTSGHVALGNPASLKISGAISIDAWINPSSMPTNGTMAAIMTKWAQAQGSGATADSYGLWMVNRNGTLRLFGALNFTSGFEPNIEGGTIPLNTWSHVAMTFEPATGRYSIYINGEQVATQLYAGNALLTTDRNVAIGKEESSLPRYFPGLIDEVEIFTRALAQSEIQGIYNAGSSGKCKAGSTPTPTPGASPTPGVTPTPTATPVATPTPGVTPTPGTAVYRINSGGGPVGLFSADAYFSNSSTYSAPFDITLGSAVNPAPTDVYRTERYADNFNYTFPGLTPGSTYTARLHFADLYWNAPGLRKFNVAINGSPVLSDYDIIAEAGGGLTAVVKEFVTTADSSGRIVIAFSTGSAGIPKVNGLEIITGGVPSGTPTPTPTPTLTPIPTPTVPAGNRRIAFDRSLAAAATTGDIVLMNEDGSNQVQITSGAGSNFFPRWSPDGSKIAFASNRAGNFEIYIMNADGTNPTRLTNKPGDDYVPTWSPDGTRIAFTGDPLEANNLREIYVINTDGTNMQRLTNAAGPDSDPAWSPDGTKIAFHGFRDGFYQIYVMGTDGTNQTRLTESAGHKESPAWSPDGTKIAYTMGINNIAVMNANGTGATQLTNYQSGTVVLPAWSPDGARLSFGSNDGNNSTTLMDIWLINADGSGLVRITNDPGFDRYSHWKPGTVATPTPTPNPTPTPTPSGITISGRVFTSTGLGLRNAVVTLTDAQNNQRRATTSSFGVYSFDNVPLASGYTLTVSSKRFRFAPRSLEINGSMPNVDFVGLE